MVASVFGYDAVHDLGALDEMSDFDKSGQPLRSLRGRLSLWKRTA